MLIPSIDLMGGKIVQLVQGERKTLEFDDFNYWIERFSSYPLVQLIDLDAAMGNGNNRELIAMICQRLPCQTGGGIRTLERARDALRDIAFEPRADRGAIVWVRGGTYSKFKVETGKKYFVNVGAIGQPRDNNPKAAYVVYDVDEGTIELRRLEYDIPAAQKKILDAGLPPRLAERLAFGR